MSKGILKRSLTCGILALMLLLPNVTTTFASESQRVFGYAWTHNPAVTIYPLSGLPAEEQNKYYGWIQDAVGAWEWNLKNDSYAHNGNWHINVVVGSGVQSDIYLYVGWDRTGYYCVGDNWRGTPWGGITAHSMNQTSLSIIDSTVLVLRGCRDQELNQQEFERVVMHEIGHALGLNHATKGIMDPSFDKILIKRTTAIFVCPETPQNPCTFHGDHPFTARDFYVSDMTICGLRLLYGDDGYQEPNYPRLKGPLECMNPYE